MMMRQRTARFQNLVTSRVLELQKDFLRIRNPLVVKPEIEIDGDSGSIHLSQSRSDEGLTGQVSAFIFIQKTALDVVAQRQCVTPGNGGFEGFRDDVITHEKVADVRNAVGQLVPSSAILTTCFHAAVPRSNA